MKNIASKRLVVDASLMRAAGEIGKGDGNSQKCREVLMAIRRICHRVVITKEIADEWDKHQSAFSRRWRVSMVAIRKVAPLKEKIDDGLRELVVDHAPTIHIASIMLKDIRLIEAAMGSDNLIISLDDAARGHFANLSIKIPRIGEIAWLNPCLIKEPIIDWLEAGAPVKENYKLKFLGQ